MSSAVPGRVLGALVGLAGALIAAFVLAPRLLANQAGADFGGEDDLRHAFGAAFVDYWHSGTREFTAELANIVDYWFRYHLAKAVLAALLLAVLVTLAVLLWRRFMAAGGTGTRVALAASGGVATVLALCSLVLVLANAQGTVAPFASLLPMATDEVRAEVGQRLADGTRTPPLDAMIDDFARYHLAMAVLAAVTAASLLGVCALLWRTRRRSPDGRSRRVLAAFCTLSAVLALALIVVAVANTTNASDPVPGLAALFTGGW
ncbi:hypothetical protein [Nocardia sp. NPDC058705]|uniref:hypothetical protein n=1 Tax=Nocardia sp. NPDC058705 TaxID=3346609 RepID=UPI00368271EC